MKAKHTPGPWKSDKYGLIIGGTDSCTSVAQTYICEWLQSGKSRNADEARANARLIAAAPDLLAALEAMTAYAASFTANGCTRDEGAILDELRLSRPAAFSDAVHRSRAAIAKARGES